MRSCIKGKAKQHTCVSESFATPRLLPAVGDAEGDDDDDEDDDDDPEAIGKTAMFEDFFGPRTGGACCWQGGAGAAPQLYWIACLLLQLAS